MLNTIIKNILVSENTKNNQTSNNFRVSSAGKCHLARCWKREQIPESNPFSTGALGILTIGTVVHEIIQDLLQKHNFLVEKELFLRFPEWELAGSLDALIRENNKLILYDFKTMNSQNFLYLTAAKRQHIFQVITYWLMLCNSTKYKTVDEVRIAYICKDTLKIKDFIIDITDEKLVMSIVQDWETLLKIWRNKEYLNAVDFKKNNSDYLKDKTICNTYCSYYEFCKNLCKEGGIINV